MQFKFYLYLFAPKFFHKGKKAVCFCHIIYTSLVLFPYCFISAATPLRSWNSKVLRRLLLSLIPDTRVLRMKTRVFRIARGLWFITRYLGTLEPRLWIYPNIGSCTDYHTLVFDFALDILALPKCRCAMHSDRISRAQWAFSDLVSLENRTYSVLASPLILGNLAPPSLAPPTNRVNHQLWNITALAMFIEPSITLVPSGFSGLTQKLCWKDTWAPVAHPSLWPSGIGSHLGRNRLWVRFLAVSDIYLIPMFSELTITWVFSGFSGYIWLNRHKNCV